MANGKPGLPKGRTNNPNGRPKKGETFTDVLSAKYSKEEFIAKCWALFMEGDTTAMKYLGDRWEGSPRQTIAGDSENPLMGFVIKRVEPDAGSD